MTRASNHRSLITVCHINTVLFTCAKVKKKKQLRNTEIRNLNLTYKAVCRGWKCMSRQWGEGKEKTDPWGGHGNSLLHQMHRAYLESSRSSVCHWSCSRTNSMVCLRCLQPCLHHFTTDRHSRNKNGKDQMLQVLERKKLKKWWLTADGSIERRD